MINVGDLLTVLRLQDELTPGVLNAVSQLQELDKAAQLTAYKITLLGRGFTEAGVLASAMFTVPILGALDATIKFGSEFETQMTRVVTLAGATREQVDGMRESVLSLAGETAVAPAELAKGMYVLMSTGRSTAEAMDVLQTTAKMTALGMGDMHDTTLAITGAMFAYRESNLTANEAANILIKSVRLGNMEIQDLVPAIARVNPVAAALGVSFKDVAAGMATFTHAGVDSAVAATGMRAMLSNILNDSAKTEKGFKQLSDALGDSSISMANFRKEMTEKGFTTAMVDLMNKVTAAGENGVSAINKIFPNIRALTEALFVYKTNGGLVVDMMNEMNKSGDVLNEATKELEKTWAFQWKQMKVAVEKLWISLSDSLIPIFKNLLELMKSGLPIIEGLVKTFNEFPVPVQMAILGLAGLAAAIGPLLLFAGQLLQAYGNISRAITVVGWQSQTEAIIANTAALTANTLAVGANEAATVTHTASQWRWISAMGESVSGLTKLGWAINVAGGAFAGWELGRVISNIFDLDNKVAGLLSRLRQIMPFMGAGGMFGSLFPSFDPALAVAMETAAAQQDTINKAIKDGASSTITYSDALKYNQGIMDGTIQKHKLGTDTVLGFVGSVQDSASAAIKGAIAHKTLLESVAAMTEKQKTAIITGQQAGLTAKQILEAMNQLGIGVGVTTDMISVYERQHAKTVATTKTHTAEIKKMDAAFEHLVNSMKVTEGGFDKIFKIDPNVLNLIEKFTGDEDKVKDLGDALHNIQMMGKDTPEVLNKVAKAAGDLYRAGDKLTPELIQLAAAFGELGPKVEEGFKGINFTTLGQRIDIENFPKQIDTFGKSVSILSNEFAKLGQIAGGSLSKIYQDIGSLFTQLKMAHDLTKQIGGSESNTTKTNIGGNWGALSVVFSKTAADGAQKASAAIAAAGAVVNGAMNVWKAAMESGTKATATFNAAMAGMQAGAVFGPWGAAIGAGVSAITGFIASLSAGRREVEKFAESMGGFDKLHEKLLETLGKVGEDFWIQLTQKVKRGDKAGADAVIKAIQDALANAPVNLAEEAGYKTFDELQKIADKAKQVYDFMVASGKYSAEQIADAYKKMRDAQIAAMDDVSKATYNDAIKARDAAQKIIDDLDGKIKSLKQSIEQEAPEEVMGLVEAAQRKQLTALEEQRAQAQKDLDAANKAIDDAVDAAVAAAAEAAQQAAKMTVNAIQGALDAAEFRVKVKVDGLPNSPLPQKEGGDYLVTQPTLFLAGEAGPERASFSGANFKRDKTGGGGGTTTVVAKLFLNGREVAEAVVPEIPGVVSDYGLAR